MEKTSNDEKYFLKWNSHHSIMANTVLEQLTREELVDVTLSCEGRYIKAHRLVLSGSSQHFKEIFQQSNSNNIVIVLMNVKFQYLQYIIDYIYKGEIQVLSSEIEGILKLAHTLQIKGLCGILNKKFNSLTGKNAKNSTLKTKDSNEENHIHDEAATSIPISPTSQNVGLDKGVNLKQKNESTESKQSNAICRRKNIEEPISPKRRRRVILKRKSEKEPPVPTDHENRTAIETNEPANGSSQVVLTEQEVEQSMLSQDMNKPADPLVIPLQEPEITIKEELDQLSTDSECNSALSARSADGWIAKPINMKQTSAFMLFTVEYRPKVSSAYPEENYKQISFRLSRMWKNLPNYKKDLYYEAASRANEKVKRIL